MMNYSGLYTAYKLNRPLTVREKNSQFCQRKRRKVKSIMDDSSVVRMNSTYMDCVDKYYQGSGVSSSMLAILAIGLLTMASYGIGYAIFETLSGYRSFPIVGAIIITVVILISEVFLIQLLRKEWFRTTHYPIRFNRRNQMIYVYQVSGEVLTIPWDEVFFTSASSKGAMPEWGIDGHILGDDGETVINTFSLAISVMGSKGLLSEYWEFIRCYMEEDCVQELSEMVTLCPPVEKQKEGYIFGLQYLLKIDSRLEWIHLPVKFPLALLASFARYIAMRTSKIPQWPQEVLDACQPEQDDPINVSAVNNPKHLWRYVLANEKRDVYDARYARQKAAYERIKAKLAARYNNA